MAAPEVDPTGFKRVPGQRVVPIGRDADGNPSEFLVGSGPALTDAELRASPVSVQLVSELTIGKVDQGTPGDTPWTVTDTATDTLVGAVTETAPVSDTASSGLNGRLQRVAQRLTSLIGLLPSSLGQKTAAGSLAVVLPSDGTLPLPTGAATDAGLASIDGHVDGLEGAIGTTADAAVAAGATGSLGAKLRAISRDLVANIVLAAGSNHIGEVGGNSDQITPSLTPTTGSAYAAGNVLGSGTGTAGQSGVLTLTNAMRVSGGTGILQSLLLLDHANQKPAVDILIFDSAPVSTFTDKSACPTLAATDNAKLIRRLSVAASDYVTVGGTAIAEIAPIGKVVKANGSANLYAVVVLTTGTPTFAAATDLILRAGFLRD